MFAGVGGMDLGLEASGFDIGASVEIDPIHALTHHYNFPYSNTICRDSTKITGEYILEKVKEKGFSSTIDILGISPPCQSFSNIGKRDSEDSRGQLIFETVKFLKQLQPKYFLFENVPGLNTTKYKPVLKELIEKIEDVGYSVVKPFEILDASLYSAPQRRKRLILIGGKKGLKMPCYPTETDKIVDVKKAIASYADIPVFINQDYGIEQEKIIDYPGWAYSLCHKRSPHTKVFGHIGSKHTRKTIERFKKVKPGENDKVSRFLKLDPDGLCNTLRAGTPSNRGSYTAPRPIHYSNPRCISTREAARLHTYPDWFQFNRTIWHSGRQIGNSLIPLLAKHLGGEIIKCLDIDTNDLAVNHLPPVDDAILSYSMSEAANFWNVHKHTIAPRIRNKVTVS